MILVVGVFKLSLAFIFDRVANIFYYHRQPAIISGLQNHTDLVVFLLHLPASSYSLLLNGTIKSQNIVNAEIPLDFVEGKEKLSFPDTSNPGDSVNTNSSSNNNLEGILNQLSNDIDNNTGNIDILAKNNMNVQKSIQDISSALDRSYMIGMAAIGIGAAGIVIAAAALSRKSS